MPARRPRSSKPRPPAPPAAPEPIGNVANVEERPFEFVSDFRPTGDQPRAIEAIVESVQAGHPHQVLLGVTGSGKTFTVANAIARLNRPTLVLAHNKTLATQLFQELRSFFPRNAVEYFVSYYDYYQPEAYIPSSDLYIEKDATQNERLDRLRHSATRSLLTRRDVVIVASVSCIYGLGSPEAYYGMKVEVARGERHDRDDLLRALVAIQYRRNDVDFRRGSFRATGDVIDVVPAHAEASAIRIELFGDEVDRIAEIDPLTGEIRAELDRVEIYPKSHYVTPEEQLERALETIEEELVARLSELRGQGRLLEAQRLESRTRSDLEFLREIGTCKGIENYSRHLTGRAPGEPPPTLLDYLPPDALLVVDESHVMLPQVRAMYKGDRSRKENLVRFGFRLPSALDNRPLTFEEFAAKPLQRLYVSATPAAYELELAGKQVFEQIVRPTGLLDPEVEVRPTREQVHDLLDEVRACAERGERALVTTLTKRMAEDLCEFFLDEGVRCKYMHADIDTLERSELIASLRAGEYDCLVGINLLREGLDLPEVALVGVLDADKEGFLRNRTSLIQTCGRAARNLNGRVLLYADRVTDSIRATLEETARRRRIQEEYNRAHGIVPRSVHKELRAGLNAIYEADYLEAEEVLRRERRAAAAERTLREDLASLRAEMLAAAEALDFERAAALRDRLFALEDEALGLEVPKPAARKPAP
ncbi:MAG: excinuclease ABC subunit UvrB [Planctomycetota bacterium]|nr:MAG: excinuclease ABC subunit UvrB [Planctomycetota bacterium]